MHPAFRIKGVWPMSRSQTKPDRTHPVTGVQLPRPGTPELIVQLPKNKYDDFIKSCPQQRLRYIDEDKEEIIVGSELELAQRLEEDTLHAKLINADGNARFYTAVPQFMHVFHLADDDRARGLWKFVEAATVSRNRDAHKLWTSLEPRTESDILDILNRHASEFMNGYDFEGFNSHYNYLSNAGLKLKEIAARRAVSAESKASVEKVLPSFQPRLPLIPTTTTISPANLSMPDSAAKSANVEPMVSIELARVDEELGKLQRYRDALCKETQALGKERSEKTGSELADGHGSAASITTAVSESVHRPAMRQPYAFRTICQTTEENHQPVPPSNLLLRQKTRDISSDLADISSRLNQQLEEARETMSNLVSNSPAQSATAKHASTSDVLDAQLKVARSTTNFLNDARARYEYASQHDTKQHTTTVLPIPNTTTQAEKGGAPNLEGTQQPDRRHSLITNPFVVTKTRNHPVPATPNPFPVAQDFLTSSGLAASQYAGQKLNYQLFGNPKQYNGFSQNDVQRWAVHSRDPPLQKQKGLQLNTPRSGNPSGSTAPFIAVDHEAVSLQQPATNPKAKSDTHQTLPEEALSTSRAKKTVRFDIASSEQPKERAVDATDPTQLSDVEILNLRQLIKTLDEGASQPTTSQLHQRYADDLNPAGILTSIVGSSAPG